MTTNSMDHVPQDSKTVHRIAKVMWAVPALLIALTINQVLVSLDIIETLETGTPALATVTEYERIDRADVTFGYVSLSIDMEDGSTLLKDKMTLPYTLLQGLEGETELTVIVNPGADQEVVIASIASTQWKIAAFQSVMAFVGFIMSAVGVFYWNRSLKTSQ